MLYTAVVKFNVSQEIRNPSSYISGNYKYGFSKVKDRAINSLDNAIEEKCND